MIIHILSFKYICYLFVNVWLTHNALYLQSLLTQQHERMQNCHFLLSQIIQEVHKFLHTLNLQVQYKHKNIFMLILYLSFLSPAIDLQETMQANRRSRLSSYMPSNVFKVSSLLDALLDPIRWRFETIVVRRHKGLMVWNVVVSRKTLNKDWPSEVLNIRRPLLYSKAKFPHKWYKRWHTLGSLPTVL
jgi:hypothetical protein